MISPVDMVKRMGVGGRLVPFFKCVCVYFLAVGGGEASPGPAAVAAKCAPVLCLLLAVVLHHTGLPHHKGAYARRISIGLVLSALGDALLVWPQHLVPGMAAFALAHFAYISAFGFTLTKREIYIGILLYVSAVVYCGCINPPAGLKFLVQAYAILLATMAWRGTARGGPAAVGALLFLVSDAILGYSLFGDAVEYNQILVMSTYYLGQLGITLSALRAK